MPAHAGSRAPVLYAISDRRLVAHGDLVAASRRAFAAGLEWLQVREKDLGTRPLLDLVTAIAAAAREYGAHVLVNDRVDIALAAGACGVHLSERGMEVRAARAAWPELIIGASVHSLEAALAAGAAGADFVQFGPVFATPSKAGFGPPQGLERLREVCVASPVPVVAVGGITAANAGECHRHGARGVAVIREIFAAADVTAAVTALIQASPPHGSGG